MSTGRSTLETLHSTRRGFLSGSNNQFPLAIPNRLAPSSLSSLPNRFYSLVPSMSQQTPLRTSKGPKILSSDDVEVDDMKWVKLRKIKWVDQDGKERKWEAADRTTRKESGVDAVAILALLDHPKKPLSTVIIEQYRPPIDNVVIELPAGLVDAKETPESAAVRELHEETGYGSGELGAGKAEVEDVTPLLVSDPGLTGANMKLVTVRVKLSDDETAPEPEAKLDEGEHIVKRVVPLKDLYQVLLDYDKKGATVDARLAHLAYGWHKGHQNGKN